MTILENLSATPMMQQWHACKAQAKDALLLFRLGDFYEAFYEDAIVISKEIHLTLTKRQQIPMCGVPAHALEAYLDKLLAKGYRIAIAEQMEDPKSIKGLVKREIVRIVSPGAIINSTLLSEKTNNFFVSIAQVGGIFGLAFIDLTTSEFRVLEVESKQELIDEVFRLSPAEMLVSEKFKTQQADLLKELSQSLPFLLNTAENFRFDHAFALETLLKHFAVHNLDGYGLKDKMVAILAAGALLTYLKDDLRIDLAPIRSIQTESLATYMALDRATLGNLEIIANDHKKHTLLGLLDKTRTSMGGRLLAKWIKHPLLSPAQIAQRQDAISELMQNTELLIHLKTALDQVRDLERLMIKIARKEGSPRDMLALSLSLISAVQIKAALAPLHSSLWEEDKAKIADLSSLCSKVQNALSENPPLRLSDGDVFRSGYNKELDDLKTISEDSKTWMANYQNKLKEEFGIKTLKVGYTKAFGYYIDISRGQSEKAPSFFERRQTLVSSERFVTADLKEFERKVLSAEERIKGLEAQLFDGLREEIAQFAPDIQCTSEAIARIDTLFALSLSAAEYRYVRPEVDDSYELIIKKGRHPIIERSLANGAFIPNDATLDLQNEQLYLITGPNMAGKSTFIRQVALIAIMAQIGSFVPAESARIGIIDKVFSRIGASDDLARGQSTFMVEMSETANILNNATSRSLVILDEIGRGTSTYDGISIAWAVAEFLLTTEEKRAKTLFATHYSELTQMEGKIPGVVNYQVAVKEMDSGIVFLRKIIKGGTDKSYGIHVAKLAGLPYKTIKRAEAMLLSLEKDNRKTILPEAKPKEKHPESAQLSLFNAPSPHQSVIDRLKAIDLNSTTPMDALRCLAELQGKITGTR